MGRNHAASDRRRPEVVQALRSSWSAQEGRLKHHVTDRGVRDEVCIRFARYYATAPLRACTEEVDRAYEALALEAVQQFHAASAAGIRIRPWLDEGQPYSSSRELVSCVSGTSELYVYLTASGHGSRAAADIGQHPLLRHSGITVDGYEFVFNDILRGVHDLFGHVLFGHGFNVSGELSAAYTHGLGLSTDARKALITEQVGQISAYYFSDSGLASRQERAFPNQKVFLYPDHLVDDYLTLFEETS